MAVYRVALSNTKKHKAHIIETDDPCARLSDLKTVCGRASKIWQLHLNIKDIEPPTCANCRRRLGLD